MAIVPTWKAHVNPQLLQNSVVGDILDRRCVERWARHAGYQWRDSYWSPHVTLITFLLQVLDGAKTLRSAVALWITHQAMLAGNKIVDDRMSPAGSVSRRGPWGLPSPDPSAYCQARKRLPFEAIQQLLLAVAQKLWRTCDATATWGGRRVWVVDGSSVSMPDTPELQAVFPQPAGQKPGCGFPVAQFVAVFCHATGAIVDLAIDSIRPHELTLLRRLYHRFAPGDVVLGDRAYGAYVDMALLLTRGVHSVFRLHQRRKADFRRGVRLGQDDVLTVWMRPEQWLPSCGVSRAAFAELPETLPVRLVRITHTLKGFRNRTLVVATTLLDPVETPADEVRALYRNRWTAELNLRSLKTHLGMDVLRSQSVEVVAKEIAMHLVAYNLIRLLISAAARNAGRDPHQLSFAGTLHRLRHALPVLLFARADQRTALVDLLTAWIAADTLPHRPNRREPRRVKRRPKQYSLLKKHRHRYQRHGDTTCR
jgi:hypothetical protein